jgi:hypothetical protein
MYQAEIVMGPERGHANTFHFSFSTKDGQLTGRVSVALAGCGKTPKRSFARSGFMIP